MKLSQFKTALQHTQQIIFLSPDGKEIPSHFHITEVGEINKRYIDCGGTMRTETNIGMQLWASTDYDHRLSASKLLQIITIAETKLGIVDGDIEIEYQADTIGKYELEYSNGKFVLQNTKTDCLAKDNCGIPASVNAIPVLQNACTPGSGCC
jgi:Family of unknown function (DUF6428)